jgi:hypothetical protein
LRGEVVLHRKNEIGCIWHGVSAIETILLNCGMSVPWQSSANIWINTFKNKEIESIYVVGGRPSLATSICKKDIAQLDV